MGRDYDISKEIYPNIQKLELSNLKSFFNENIAGKNYTYLVIGNKELMNDKCLEH